MEDKKFVEAMRNDEAYMALVRKHMPDTKEFWKAEHDAAHEIFRSISTKDNYAYRCLNAFVSKANFAGSELNPFSVFSFEAELLKLKMLEMDGAITSNEEKEIIKRVINDAKKSNIIVAEPTATALEIMREYKSKLAAAPEASAEELAKKAGDATFEAVKPIEEAVAPASAGSKHIKENLDEASKLVEGNAPTAKEGLIEEVKDAAKEAETVAKKEGSWFGRNKVLTVALAAVGIGVGAWALRSKKQPQIEQEQAPEQPVASVGR